VEKERSITVSGIRRNPSLGMIAHCSKSIFFNDKVLVWREAGANSLTDLEQKKRGPAVLGLIEEGQNA